MAWYSYKGVRELIPQRIIDSIEDYDHSADYDGDLWVATELYIHELLAQIARLKRGEFTTQEVAVLPYPIEVRNALRKALKERNKDVE